MLSVSLRDKQIEIWCHGIQCYQGYAQHGYSQKALDVFRQMEAEGNEMDGVTFLSVIM